MNVANTPAIKLAIADDHKLFRRGLINLIDSFGPAYNIILEANNGKELLVEMEKGLVPDLAIIDVNMPQMNGFETAQALQKNYKDVKVLVITMAEDEQTLIKMLRHGIRGYLSKDVEPEELKNAIDTISRKGYYYTDHVTGRLIHALQEPGDTKNPAGQINERELKFLQLACSEYTYKEIADIMCLSVKTVDGYRNTLFEKLQAKSRVGLVLYAVRNGLVSL